jgi:MFS family permease
MLFSPLASHLIVTFGWRLSFIAIGIINLVVVTLAAQFLRRDPAKMGMLPFGASQAGTNNLVSEVKSISFNEVIRRAQLWQVCAIQACCWFGINTFLIHIVSHATGLGISSISAANTLTIAGGLGMVGRLTFGVSADRLSSKLALAMVCALLSISLFSFAYNTTVWMMYLFSAVFGLAWGGLVVLQSTIVAEMFGLSAHGAILGIFMFSGSLVGSVGPLAAGYIFDMTESYHLAFLISTIVGVIGIILTMLLRKTRQVGSTQVQY